MNLLFKKKKKPKRTVPKLQSPGIDRAINYLPPLLKKVPFKKLIMQIPHTLPFKNNSHMWGNSFQFLQSHVVGIVTYDIAVTLLWWIPPNYCGWIFCKWIAAVNWFYLCGNRMFHVTCHGAVHIMFMSGRLYTLSVFIQGYQFAGILLWYHNADDISR